MKQYLRPNLDGDGRRVIIPNPYCEHVGNPQKMQLYRIRMVIEKFKSLGVSHHSVFASTMWCIVEWCTLNEIPYTINQAKIKGKLVGYVINSNCREAKSREQFIRTS